MSNRGILHEISIPDAPRLADLRFRYLAGRQDYARLVDVYAACADVDGLDQMMTEADMANFIDHPVGFDPERDLLVVEVGDRAVAYGWTTHRIEPSGDEVHAHRGYVDPGWRRRGIGTALIALARRRARAASNPRGTSGRRYLQSHALDSETDAKALLQRLGYAPVRFAFDMSRDLHLPIPDHPLPAGLEVRPAEAGEFRAIWEAEREAFQDSWGYYPWPEENYRSFVTFPHYEPSLWRVAWHEDQVAGGVLSYINVPENEAYRRRRGYTEDIFVRRPWRRRGLARALIALSLGALKDRGMDEAALAVDAENRTGALQLYTRLGYTTIGAVTIYRRLLDAAEPESP